MAGPCEPVLHLQLAESWLWPQAFFDIINAVPYGEELAAAFAALPNIPDPVSHGTANFSGGTFNTGPAKNGSAQFVTFAARVFSYVPCFFAVRCPPWPSLKSQEPGGACLLCSALACSECPEHFPSQ